MKKNCFPVFVILLLFYLFSHPLDALEAANQGLTLWFHTLLPSLFPFCVLSNLLIASGIIPILLGRFSPLFRTVLGLSPYGAYALFLGLLCGYPMGAKLLGDLYRQQNLTLEEGCYLLTFVNHPSPMFVTSYLSVHLLQSTRWLPVTFFVLYSSAFATSLIFRIAGFLKARYLKNNTVSYQAMNIPSFQTKPITIQVVDDSIMNGFETITKLGGYVILFSIISRMTKSVLTPFPHLQWFLSGILEMTTGAQMLMDTPLSSSLKYVLLLSFSSFGGISVIAQTKGMLSSTPFQLSTYVLGKITNALCTFVIGLLVTIFLF